MPRTIKTVLELSGEANYKKGLQSIDRALKAMSGELAAASAKFAENSASLKNVTNLSNAYKNQVEQQRVKVDSLKGAVDRSNAAYETAVQKYKDAVAANGENSKAALKAALAVDKAEKSLDGYKASLASAEKYLASSTQKMEEFASKNKNIAVLGNTIDTVKGKIKSLSFDKLKTGAAEIASKLEPVTSKFKKMATSVEELASKNKHIIILAQAVGNLKNKINYLSNGLVLLTKNSKIYQKGIEAAESATRKIKYEFAKLSTKVEHLKDKFSGTTKVIKTVGKGIATPFKAIKPIVQNVVGVFQLAAKKAAAIKQKLEPAINVCKSVAKAAAKITFKTAEVGAKAVTTSVKTAAKAFTAYASAAAGAATAVFSTIESTREYRNDLAKLEQGANTSGNSFDKMKSQLADLTALTGESDSSIEALSNLMSAGFNDNQVASAVDALSGAVIKFPDTLKIESLADSLQETIATGAGTGQFAELIGRNGDSLEDFNNGLAACSSEAERQQYALDYLAKSGLAEVNAEYEKSHKALLDYEKAEQAVTDANAKIAESAMPIAASFKQGYAGVLSAFADVLSGADATGAAFSAKIGAFLNNVANMIVQYLPVLLTAVNTIIQSVVTNLPALINMILPTLITGFNTLITGLIDALPEVLPVLLEGFVALLSSLIDALNQVIDLLVPMLPEIITRITETLIENLPLLLEGALQLFMGLIQSLNQVVEQLMPMLPQLITNLCDTLIAHIDEIVTAGFDLLIGLANGLVDCIPTLLTKVPEIINKLVSSLTEGDKLQQLIQAGIDLIVALAEGLPQAIPDIVLAIPQITTAIIGALMEVDWGQVGIDILRGIGDGLVAGVGVIGGKVKEMASGLLDSVKGAFDIHSPSRVFRDKVGIFLAQGVGVGFEEEMKKVSDDMNNAIPTSFNSVVNADATSFAKPKANQNSGHFTNGTVSYIFENINIYGDKDYEDLGYRLERERQKAQLAMGV